jgi:hypothetical protein
LIAQSREFFFLAQMLLARGKPLIPLYDFWTIHFVLLLFDFPGRYFSFTLDSRSAEAKIDTV